MNKTKCPECGGDNIAEILYGLMMAEDMDKIKNDEKFELGGCSVKSIGVYEAGKLIIKTIDSVCNDCDNRFAK